MKWIKIFVDYLKKRIKLLKMKISGYKFSKLGFLSKMLFGIAILLFLLTIIPSFFYKMPFYDYLYKTGKFPYEYNITGIVYQTVNEDKETKKNPIMGAKIHVGGYSTKTDINGEFMLEFIAQDENNIPVVVIYSEKKDIYQIDFEGKNEVYIEVDLNEK